RGVEPFGDVPFFAELRSVVGRKAELRLVARPPGARQLGQIGAQRGDPRFVQLQRRKVGLREVAVIFGFLFAALAEGLAAILLPATRLLHYLPTRGEYSGLPLQFERGRRRQRPEAVEVLDFGTGAQRLLARRPDTDIGLDPQDPFFEVAAVDAQIAQDLPERDGVSVDLFGRI